MATRLFALATLSMLFASVASHNFLISGDDGWATAQARAQYSSLVAAGFDVVLSGTAEVHNGQGDRTQTPTALTSPCMFNTCPAGSPAEGSDPNDREARLNYVNAFGPDAVEFGIDVLAPKFFGGPPDIVIAGPNVGGIPGGLSDTHIPNSSNFFVAVQAVKQGIPAIAVFGGVNGTSSVSYTTLTTNPNSTATKAALVYADLTTQIGAAVWNSGAPFMPPGHILVVNYPAFPACTDASQYKFVLAKFGDTGARSVQTCGQTTLPLASDVVNAKGCFASVTLLNGTAFHDATEKKQAVMIKRLGDFLGCLN